MRSLVFLIVVTTSAVFAQTPCGQLKSLEIPGTTVTSTESVPAGPLQMPGMPSGAVAPVLPAHCRVAVTLKPSADSDIKAEVWLPVAGGWNGKLLAEGGGGWVGTINRGAMAGALREGYTTTSTDTGHQGGSAEFALGQPKKIVDFA